MPDQRSSPSASLIRHIAPTAIVIFFALAMSACVLGIVIWKALEAKTTTLDRGQIGTQNLAHSLAEHVAAETAELQQCRLRLLHLSSRHGWAGASNQRAGAVTPDRPYHHYPLEAHQQAGRQLRGRSGRSDRQRLLQLVLQSAPARKWRRHLPDTERWHRPDPLTLIEYWRGHVEIEAVRRSAQAQFGRILQD